MPRARTSKDRSKRRERVKPTEPIEGLDLDFSSAPTTWAFLQDNSFFRGLLGPVGSGKSYACAAEIVMRAVQQDPSPVDGIRYTRFVVVRNSYPELRTTTIKTWLDLFPENRWGSMRWSPPLTHHLKLPTRGDAAGIDCEVIFLALDQPKDVRKLLSLELTGAWVNEARELPLGIVQGLTHRIGRYPPRSKGGCTYRFIIADTNPPDSDSWWHNLALKNPIKGKYPWKFFQQPGGMIEIEGKTDDSTFAAGKHWIENPNAENMQNLIPGYYLQQLGGKDLDWIRCYVGGQYAFVKDGKSVWHEYDDTSMVQEGIELDTTLPIQIGLDFGLTPAAVFGQRLPNGRWNILYEIVTEDMGLERFAQILLHELNTRFQKCEPEIWGDPAGQKRDEIFEVTSFDHLRSLGLNAQPTASNDFMVRREAGAAPMLRYIDKRPALVVDSECKRLRKSLAGGYHFKRVGISGGTDRFRDVPDKNQHSHIGDAFAYLLLGGGEHRRITRGVYRNAAFGQQAMNANLDFDIW